jgi:zinc protease
VACLAVATAALAACGAPRPPARSIQFQAIAHTSRLANGMRVMVVEDPTTNLVQLAIRLDVGSADDPTGKGGLAHLVEHLMYQLAGAPDGSPAGAQLSDVAIRFNAQTTWEATVYESVAPADHLGRLLEIEGRRFSARCTDIDPGTFEREREVVRHERALDTGPGEPDGGAVEMLMRHIYPPGHPYARPAGGSGPELSRLTLADACAFTAAHYRSDRMVVVLSGAIEPRRAIAQVARHLGRLMPGAAPTSRPIYPPLAAERRTTRGMPPGIGPVVVVAWPMPPPYSRDRAIAAIALSLLRSQLASQTEHETAVIELGERRAPVAAAIIRLGRRARADPEAVASALMAVRRAVRLATIMPTSEVLRPLLHRRARELLSGFDALPSRVRSLAAALQIGAREQSFAAELELLDRLTPRDVSLAASELFEHERARVVVMEADDTPVGRIATEARFHAGAGHDDSWTFPVDVGQAASPLRLPLPRSILARAERLRLNNGLEVILLPTGVTPLVRAQLVFAGGGADDPPGGEGLAFLAAHALDFRASRAHDGAAYKRLARLGDELEVRVDGDRTSFTMMGLSNHLDSVLAGLALLVEEGQYRDDLLDRLRHLLPSRTADENIGASLFGGRRSDSPAQLRRSLYRRAYGASHPYARAEAHWLPGAERIVREDVDALRRRRFGARNGVLIITGQFDPSAAREHAARWFASLRPGEAHLVARPPTAARTARAVVVVAADPADATTVIHIAFPTVRDPKSRAARMVLARILDERMARVREVLGAAYSASASYQDRAGTGMFVIEAAVDASRTADALAAMMAELARIRAGGSADLAASFVRARRAVLNQVVAEPSGAVAAGRLISAVLERSESLGGHEGLAQQIMALTVYDLRPVVALDLSPEHETVGLLGPADRVAAARRAAGL